LNLLPPSRIEWLKQAAELARSGGLSSVDLS
jgi:hypothetical protein